MIEVGRKPDIVCIGAQKAGTSWLHETLAGRDDIWVPPFKELHFFDHKFLMECRRWTPWHVRNGLKRARARHEAGPTRPDPTYLAYLDRLAQSPAFNTIWYRAVFAPARTDQKCLDVTPEYSCIPQKGVDYFKRFLPQSRVIYVIRDPLERLCSQLRMMAQRAKQTPVDTNTWHKILAMPALRTRGDYICNVARWDSRFASDQLLYVPFGEIKSDPHGVLAQIESHCALPPALYETAHRKVHATRLIEIPDFVLAHFREHIDAQNRFLQNRFGGEFFDASA